MNLRALEEQIAGIEAESQDACGDFGNNPAMRDFCASVRRLIAVAKAANTYGAMMASGLGNKLSRHAALAALHDALKEVK
jgi:hypothetical protein